MNILLIENQPLADTIKSKRTDIEIYGGLDLTVEEIAADIKSRLVERYDVIVIGVHVQIANSMLSDNAGIKFLKLFRLHHIDKHVVLYSWMSREMLMGNLHNAIVFSKGVTFYSLPNFINEVQDLDFDKLSHETADKNELLPLFRAEYDPVDRHFDANMFGVWQLMRVQDAYEKMYDKGCKQNKDEESRKKIYAYLNSYNGKVMQYISGQYSENLEDRLREETKRFSEKARKERLQYAISSIKAVDAELHDVQIRIEAINRLIPVDSKHDEGASLLQRIVDKIADKKLASLAIDETRELVQRKVDLEKERERFESMKAWAETPADSSGESDEPVKFDNVTIEGIRTALNERRPHIVYVDDMADKGWADMLKRMVYQSEEDYGYLTSIVPTKNDSVDTIVGKICEVKDPQLIILDLRLKDEKGYYAPADLSGFQVLQKLQEKNPPCAILVFTASNKVWSLKEAFKGNVMSYWTKGGLDNMDKTNDGVNNYLDLLCQINYLTNYKWMFELLAKIGEVKRKIENKGKTYWWETKDLTFSKVDKNNNEMHYKRVLTDKNSMIELIKSVLQTTQSDLRQMFFFENNEKARGVMLNSFVMRVADILEQIYYYNERDDDYINLTERMKMTPNGDNLWFILKVRNRSAHSGYLSPKEIDVIEYVYYVLKYVIPGVDEPIITPIEDRRKFLEEGRTITSEVYSINVNPKNSNQSFYKFDIGHIDGIQVRLYDNNNIIHRKLIDIIKEGDIVDVKQNKDIYYTITYCYNASVFDDENAEMGSDDEQIQLTE